MAAHYASTYSIPATMQQMIAAMLDPSFANQFHLTFKAGNPTPTGAIYQFRHGVTMTSWGENITLTLTPLGPTMTQLSIRSECSLPTQVVDWGKNKKNVTEISAYLTTVVTRYPAVPVAPAPAPVPVPTPAPPASTAACCDLCGHPLTPNAVFCCHCGSRV